MQLTAATMTNSTATHGGSAARYGGQLHVRLPEDHWAYSPGYETYQTDPRIVVVGQALRKDFGSLADAVSAAREVSAGPGDAVAVVRDPGSRGPWHVERLLAKAWNNPAKQGYHPIDLEGVVTAGGSAPDVLQPLNSQRQVIIEAIVDGALLLDDVNRYSSSRPDLPGRDPDAAPSKPSTERATTT